MSGDPRVDAYIARAQPFAQPLLSHIRTLMQQSAAPLDEAIKWGFPAFLHKGTIVATMAAFKAHASFGFWYGRLVTGDTGHEGPGMGSFGRLTVLADLPADEAIAAMIAQSVALIDAGVKPPHVAEKKPPKPEAAPHPALAAALAASAAAQAVWDGFAPGQRRGYCDWITEAKRDETRDKRIALAVEWIAQGKIRHWKYENC